ncbi:hypothetical protein RhiirA5_479867 [Rhizophagus irregularis]|uniref:Uncharacterized protein n=2 Tax=Rhizophagus irregularis TaxID=588596 RepID=A0A2N0QAC7_9GLOM|nr:hypothetical protein GLOIN_2v1487932 [Rhizophagus irregularis DAOM 181602=DAOM 197198]PKC16012.1 hypothetical protein RhiirA5_479867 [Rhizophagus irregularis]PKC75917.1 hypothetical protein RhiirA1_491147 [Rhizophagus irregularis]POG59291.1 hypothetical protein GLOIN_2v1487932 [Rhizophagus irregularis DAOM 181602=DAOM 197198]UZO24612.1 hypothetical protein OCT59_016908 [Rhizophagus irregularis]GET65927.1 hypothetical protein GLOIN_2v1487932 [Rhizophagus irregularis DAOM 181602=DAOM 197198]|eukprot:XP_025166157.1 hypothetical protein GLOIN_2v1487932 [Rhizophagus irregularis DAOM 181602=DAOM 197198]
MYNEIKRRIWIPRCDEVKRLEEKINIKKADLRKNKKDLNKFPDEDEKNDKNDKKLKTAEKLEKDNKNRLNKKISLVTLNKLTGKLADNINIDNSWDTTVKLVNYLD